MKGKIVRFNNWLAAKITSAVSTMWAAYAFAFIAIAGYIPAFRDAVSWFSQTFLQLVLISVIMVYERKIAKEEHESVLGCFADVYDQLREIRAYQLASTDSILYEMNAAHEFISAAIIRDGSFPMATETNGKPCYSEEFIKGYNEWARK